VLSTISIVFPVAGAFLMPSRLADYQALLWLWALIPAFVLTHWRGWTGVATAIAAAMAIVSVTYAATTAIGREIPDLLYAVLAAYVAIALGIGFLRARLSDRPGEDAGGTLIERLTGLPSREHADYHLVREVEAARLGRPLALVLFRLDGFDSFIDTNGEAAANGVLRAVASILKQHTRHANLSARYDRDLFMCILSGSGADGALVFAERVQERLRAARSMAALPSASVGIAVFGPDTNDRSDLIDAAMNAVTAATRGGGDRIRVHGPASSGPVPPATDRSSRTEHASATGGPPSPTVSGRDVFVHARDADVRTELVKRLGGMGVRVREGDSGSDMIVPLRTEFDAVILELSADSPAMDLVRELRERWPATRVIGIPPIRESNVPASVLRVRVDGHYLPVDGEAVFDPPLRELFSDRDRMRTHSLETKQLSDELTAGRLEAQAALNASEARYRSVVETMRDVVLRLDGAGVITSLNAAWAPISGYGIEESMGTRFLDVIADVDRDALASELT
jgi:diguanylate cyclase (GGDEF)-like protein